MAVQRTTPINRTDQPGDSPAGYVGGGTPSYRGPRPLTPGLALATLGVVYGDIGTSPLYAFRECFHGTHQVSPASAANVLGVISLIIWALMLTITFKYMFIILRADNDGEGGILALTALLRRRLGATGRLDAMVMLLGVFGSALLYGDGVITPAVSVLSALEGLSLAAPVFTPWIVPLTIGILVGLFVIQSRGTERIGAVFGPVMLLWFAVLAMVGLASIATHPQVLAAVSPHHAVGFLLENGWTGFFILGVVFLVVTGGEALYADMGHVGRRPIRVMWFSVVLPALVLNYLGQGAVVLRDPAAAENPFYRMLPSWALIPMVVLAAVATVVASQAVISGAFSLTMQAVQLGYLPRVRIRHTSAREFGQIYVPFVNGLMLVATILLVLSFRTSGNLASAYGLAVTTTMVITTVLTYLVMRHVWQWPTVAAVLVSLPLLALDTCFFLGNVVKIPDGGWVPLVIGLAGLLVMTTWRRGRALLEARLDEARMPYEEFFTLLDTQRPTVVKGTTIYLCSSPDHVPRSLVRNVRHNHVMHQRVAVVAVQVERRPFVPAAERLTVVTPRESFHRITIRYGFAQLCDVPAALGAAPSPVLDLDPGQTSYVLGGEILQSTDRPGMPRWREELFIFLMRNALSATAFFQLPADNTLEIARQVDL